MIKRFAQCLREYKWTALVSPVCMIGEVAMEVTIPLVMADLYDYGIAVGNMTVVWQKALQLLICAIVSLMFGVMSANYASKAATALPGICATICTTGCRISASPILTNSPRPPLSPG